ncbi:hypothetical protein CU097_010695 [Rhizopus azygosporus]|uniref:Uncharacterized protein n=1 Tax=Rhizopus azygosporus TaxID=86630 RepID=A0A367JK84_RHIAZ|nr:hypothetical protein CU097_010695 [Rhizopus azygosporus]
MRSSFITLTFAVACLLGSSLASPIYVKRDAGLGEALGNVGGTVKDIANIDVPGDVPLVGGNDVQDTVGGATEVTSDIQGPLPKRASPADTEALKILNDPLISSLIRSATRAASKRDLPIDEVTGLTGDLPVDALTGFLGESPASTDSPASTPDASTNVGPSVEDGQAMRKRGPTDILESTKLTGTATDLTGGALNNVPLPSPDNLPISPDAVNEISPELAAALASASDVTKGGLPSLPLGKSKDESDTAAGTAPAAPADAAKPDNADSASK